MIRKSSIFKQPAYICRSFIKTFFIVDFHEVWSAEYGFKECMFTVQSLFESKPRYSDCQSLSFYRRNVLRQISKYLIIKNPLIYLKKLIHTTILASESF